MKKLTIKKFAFVCSVAALVGASSSFAGSFQSELNTAGATSASEAYGSGGNMRISPTTQGRCTEPGEKSHRVIGGGGVGRIGGGGVGRLGSDLSSFTC